MWNGKVRFIDDEVLIKENVNVNDTIRIHATYALMSAPHLALYRLRNTQ